MGGVVGSDALLSSSPSLIWLQLGFGLAGAVTTSRPWLSVSGSELRKICPFDFVSPLQITLSRFSSFSKGSDGSLTEHFHLRYFINKKRFNWDAFAIPKHRARSLFTTL